MALTITPQTRLNLHMVVTTMTSERRFNLGNNGVAALERFRQEDEKALTVKCYLFNRVWNYEKEAVEDVLVYAHEDVMPRWATAWREKSIRERRAADKALRFASGEGIR